MFIFDGNEGEVIPARSGGWGRISGITISFDPRGRTLVHCSVLRCKKDGTQDRRFGTGVRTMAGDFDTAPWIAKARAVVDSGAAS
jgi:hypothetical protein